MRFLYQGSDDKPHRDRPNAGLWYDKFFDQWQFDRDSQHLIVGDEGKATWVKNAASKVGDNAQLEQHIQRMTKLLEHHNQAPLFYKLESDFVTGLGREHPVENGFAWHHTLGTPYLPGSSVKGLVRAWAQQWAEADAACLEHIFGSASKDVSEKRPFQVGSVIFLDALPLKPVPLKADIMTPHYSPYYQDDTGNTPPADWHNPTPIPFLVVEKEQTFMFGVLPRRQHHQNDCKTVQQWLQDALSWLGAGAKTAVGYGRFTLVKNQADDSSTPTDAPASSILDEYVEGLRNTRNSDIKSRAQGYVDKLKAAEASEEDKRKAAASMKDILERRNIKQLNKLKAYQQLCSMLKES